MGGRAGPLNLEVRMGDLFGRRQHTGEPSTLRASIGRADMSFVLLYKVAVRSSLQADPARAPPQHGGHAVISVKPLSSAYNFQTHITSRRARN